MIVDSYITLREEELANREWRKLFDRMRYVDAEQNVHEPWRYMPEIGKVRLPRGAWNLLPHHVRYVDQRVCPKMPKLKYALELDASLPDGRKYQRQKEAVKAMLFHEQGLIVRPPGTGKSQIALAFAAACETNVLIIVHTEDILQQWIEYAGKALPEIKIGVVRAEEFTIGQVTIATVQTAIKHIAALRSRFGAVILDEAHHASAKTFETVLNRMQAKYRFGMTATTSRADGKAPYMRLVIGPVIHREKFKSPVKVCVKILDAGFHYAYRGRWDWGNLLRALVRDKPRNALIAETVDREVRAGNSILVLSRRIEHLTRIAAMTETYEKDGALLVGAWEDPNGDKHRLSRDTRKLILQEFREGKIKAVFATQLADEALDVPRLSRVVLTHPGKAEGRIIQQVGRALREAPGKRDAVIYDCRDLRVGVLRNQWNQRRQHYKKMGIPILKKKGK